MFFSCFLNRGDPLRIVISNNSVFICLVRNLISMYVVFSSLKEHVESVFNGGNNFSSSGSVLAGAARGMARRGARAGRCATHYNNATLRAAAALRLRRGHAPALSDSGNGDRFECTMLYLYLPPHCFLFSKILGRCLRKLRMFII